MKVPNPNPQVKRPKPGGEAVAERELRRVAEWTNRDEAKWRQTERAMLHALIGMHGARLERERALRVQVPALIP